MLGVYLQRMNMRTYVVETAPDRWEPARDEAGRIRKPPPERLCWVLLAMRNGGHAVDAQGNVVLVGARRLRRRARRASRASG